MITKVGERLDSDHWTFDDRKERGCSHDAKDFIVASTIFDSTTGYYPRKIKTLAGKHRKIKLSNPAIGEDTHPIPPEVFAMAEQFQDEPEVAVRKLETNPQIPTFGPKDSATESRIDLYKHLETYCRHNNPRRSVLSQSKIAIHRRPILRMVQ